MANNIFDIALKEPVFDAEPIFIEQALKSSGHFYCPSCLIEVYPRRKGIDGRAACFSHKRGSAEDRIGYACEAMLNSEAYGELKEKYYGLYDVTDISDWHLEWQAVFDKLGFEIEYTEKDENGRFCRADAINKELKTVVEFQHSVISYKDFKRRNDFWCKRGFRTIWLFDFDNYWDDTVKYIKPEQLTEAMRNRNDKYYHIDRYNRILGDFYPQAEINTTVFVENIVSSNRHIRKFNWLSDNQEIMSLERFDIDRFVGFCLNQAVPRDINEVENARAIETKERMLRLKYAEETKQKAKDAQRLEAEEAAKLDYEREAHKEKVFQFIKDWIRDNGAVAFFKLSNSDVLSMLLKAFPFCSDIYDYYLDLKKLFDDDIRTWINYTKGQLIKIIIYPDDNYDKVLARLKPLPKATYYVLYDYFSKEPLSGLIVNEAIESRCNEIQLSQSNYTVKLLDMIKYGKFNSVDDIVKRLQTFIEKDKRFRSDNELVLRDDYKGEILDMQLVDEFFKKHKVVIPTSDQRIYLPRVYDKFDISEVKRLGAKFDWAAKMWYVPPGVDSTPFKVYCK